MLHKTLSTTNWKWAVTYIRPISILNHQNLPWWVAKVKSQEEMLSNRILWKPAFKFSMLTHLARPSYAQYRFMPMNWY